MSGVGKKAQGVLSAGCYVRIPRFTVGWPLKSCTHTGIFPSVSGSSAVKRKPRKVPIVRQVQQR